MTETMRTRLLIVALWGVIILGAGAGAVARITTSVPGPSTAVSESILSTGRLAPLAGLVALVGLAVSSVLAWIGRRGALPLLVVATTMEFLSTAFADARLAVGVSEALGDASMVLTGILLATLVGRSQLPMRERSG